MENAKLVHRIKQLRLQVPESPRETAPVSWSAGVGVGRGSEAFGTKPVGVGVGVGSLKEARRGGVGALGARRLRGARLLHPLKTSGAAGLQLLLLPKVSI